MKISVIIAAYNAEKYLEVIDRKSIRLKNLTEDLVRHWMTMKSLQ